ncbi:MAG: histidine kinase [Desulfobacteraceae bacterium]|nr:histidine kinase [Desulfobacteraceae bacterium]
MKLTDLQPLDEWQRLEDEIRTRSGLSASVFGVDGVRITDNLHWVNRLCPDIKANPKGQSFICATAHMNIAIQAKASGDAVLEECDAGLIKMVVPIMVDDVFIGAVGACGLLLDDGEVDSFLVNKITGIDDEKVEDLAEGIPAIDTDTAKALGAYIKKRVDAVVAAYQTS